MLILAREGKRLKRSKIDAIKTSRRTLLKSLAAMLALPPAQAIANSFLTDAGSAPKALTKSFKVSAWKGDDFTLGHRLRINDLPPLKPGTDTEKTVDYVIVGGGMSGLAAAYYLQSENFILLEQYAEPGGQSRGGSFQGIDYSLGPAYIGTVDGIYGELFADLGISAVKLDASRNSFMWQKLWEIGPESKALSLNKQFKLLKEELAHLDKVRSDSGEQSPPTTGVALNKLDALPMSECLKSYEPDFINLMDAFIRSSLCGGISQVSALAGYSALSEIFEPAYVFKGGNPCIAKALAERIEQTGSGRIICDAFVWKVSMNEDGAEIIYSHKDNSTHKIKCKAVILTTPPLVAWRQLHAVSDMLKAQLMKFRFGSYLVANLLFSRKVFTGSYDSFLSGGISDIIIAETPYIGSGSYSPEMGSVLTVYRPFPWGTEGRSLLETGDRQAIANQLLTELLPVIPAIDNHLEEVVLSRWGHAMAIVDPGYFQRTAKVTKEVEDTRLALAHCSISGGPAAEAAIQGANIAVKRLKKQLLPGQR